MWYLMQHSIDQVWQATSWASRRHSSNSSDQMRHACIERNHQSFVNAQLVKFSKSSRPQKKRGHASHASRFFNLRVFTFASSLTPNAMHLHSLDLHGSIHSTWCIVHCSVHNGCPASVVSCYFFLPLSVLKEFLYMQLRSAVHCVDGRSRPRKVYAFASFDSALFCQHCISTISTKSLPAWDDDFSPTYLFLLYAFFLPFLTLDIIFYTVGHRLEVAALHSGMQTCRCRLVDVSYWIVYFIFKYMHEYSKMHHGGACASAEAVVCVNVHVYAL